MEVSYKKYILAKPFNHKTSLNVIGLKKLLFSTNSLAKLSDSLLLDSLLLDSLLSDSLLSDSLISQSHSKL